MAGEADLVRAVASGSEEALAALYDRHADGVHAVALRLTSDRQLAEEVVQETFLALWNRAELFNPALASLATWLRTIARNRTVDRLRAAGRRPPLVPLPGYGDGDEGDPGFDRVRVDAVVLGGAAPDPGPEAAAEAAESSAAVGAAIAGMPEEERTVIVLAYREGLTQSEIAERLAWPLGTVKTRTRRALARLRAVLEAEEGRPARIGGEDRMDDHGTR
jgi:RNA polymerase sigma-70 factor (ECF subfamily)